ncbi:MAG TPA: HEAT repeat domain-containing protein [Gemmataceae bacterium]|nr:HEAT repeat domain-containing protein [Gemmataceae bacterium]
MPVRFVLWSLVVGLLIFLPCSVVPAADGDAVLTDEQTLRAAGLGTDGPALLEFFRKRANADSSPERISALVKELGNLSPEARDKAVAELVCIGTPAVLQLRQALRDPDDRVVAAQARRCLEFLEGTSSASLSAAAAHLLANAQTDGAAEALLSFLPFAEDDNVLEDIKGALAQIAIKDGKPDPALLKSLDDPISLRRVTAAEALCQGGRDDLVLPVRKLLKDSKPAVRLRVALALAQYRDPNAVGTLIKLLAELPTPLAKQAEDYLVNLAGEQSQKFPPLGDDANAHKKCSEAWDAWWKTTEDCTKLIQEFKKRTLDDSNRDKIIALIKQLGDDSFEVREKADADLVAMGEAAVPLLRQNMNHQDPEISQRIRKFLESGKEKAAAASAVSARLLALHKPEGAAEALLGYLPFAEDENLAQEVQGATAAVAFRQGKPDPAVIKALEDKAPSRRAAAAEALCQPGGEGWRANIKKLLADPDASVQLRTALALANARDKEAIPALIGQMGDGPYDQGVLAEEFLRTLAGETAPASTLENTADSRKKVKDAWNDWFKVRGPSLVLGKPSSNTHYLGYTLLVCIDPNTNMGSLVELGAGNKKRWQIDGLNYPWGAQVLPGNRVLIAEHNLNRVTERDLKGTVLWEHRCNNQPVSLQRLPNGNTFIATRGQLMEVDKSGKEVFTYNWPNGTILEAKKQKNGNYAFVTQNAEYIRIDKAGKQLKNSSVAQLQWYGCQIDILPNDHVIYPQYSANKVTEYDGDGKIVWEATVQWPTSAFRLPNGNTLVACQQQQKVFEINKAGKVVSEYKDTLHPMRAQRR